MAGSLRVQLQPRRHLINFSALVPPDALPIPSPDVQIEERPILLRPRKNTVGFPSITPTPSPSPSPSAGPRGVSPGAVAGVAIGCLIGGALIMGVILFLISRRKKNFTIDSTEESDRLTTRRKPVPCETIVVQEKLGRSVSVLDQYQPQSAEEDTISSELCKLREKIRSHVQSYYHHGTMKPSSVNEDDLHGLATATGMSTANIKSLLLNPDTRSLALCQYIGWIVLSRCGGGQVHWDECFLPPEVARFESVMAKTNNLDAGQTALVSKWKAVSGALLLPIYRQENLETDSRGQSIEEALETVDLFLEPFVSVSADPTQRIRNLEGAMRRTAQFALLLYSQPSSWRFDWSSVNGTVIFPALIQTVDNGAQVLLPPRVFAEAEMMGAD